jgi:hypothetical protein
MFHRLMAVAILLGFAAYVFGADAFSYPPANTNFANSATISASGACLRVDPPMELPIVVDIMKNSTSQVIDSGTDGPTLQPPSTFPWSVEMIPEEMGGWPTSGAHTLRLWPNDHTGTPTATLAITISP